MKISAIAKVYSSLIIKGVKVFNDVPEKLKDQVKEELTNSGHIDLIEGDN